MKLDDIRKVFMEVRPAREEPAPPPSARPRPRIDDTDLFAADGTRATGCGTCQAIGSGHFFGCAVMERELPHPGSVPDRSEGERHELFLARKNKVALAQRAEIDYQFHRLSATWRGMKMDRDTTSRMEQEVNRLLHRLAQGVVGLEELTNVEAMVTWSAQREEFSVQFQGTTQDADALVKDFFAGRSMFKEIER